MTKTKRGLLQVARAVLALLTVLWVFSLAQVVTRILTEPGFFGANWFRVLIAVAATLLPAWGYLRLTEIVKRSSAPASTEGSQT